jgi:GGDEF domain-containing protein
MDHNRLYLNFATLGVWLILASIVLVWTDSTTIILTLALLAFTTTLGLTNPFRYAGWVAMVLGILILVAAQYYTQGFNANAWLAIGAGAISLVGAATLASITIRQTQGILGQLERDRKLIDELRVYDPETSLIKWQYARQSLKNEIARSQRFHNDLCLIMIQVAGWNGPAEGTEPVDIKEIKNQVSTIILNTLRTVDIPFSSGKLGAILPATGPDGAYIAAERLVEASARKVRVAMNVGIAHFPNDGVIDEDLIKDAEAALLVSTTSDRSVVLFGQVAGALEKEKSQQALPPTEKVVTQVGAQESAEPAQANVKANPAVISNGVDKRVPVELRPGETGIRIEGIRNVSKIQPIQTAIEENPAIESVRLISYVDNTLIMGVTHHAYNLTELIENILNMPVKEASTEKNWVIICLEEAEQSPAAKSRAGKTDKTKPAKE